MHAVCVVHDIFDVLHNDSLRTIWLPSLTRFLSSACLHFSRLQRSVNILQRYTDPILHTLHASYCVMFEDERDYDSCDDEDKPFIRCCNQFYRITKGTNLPNNINSDNACSRFVNYSTETQRQFVRERRITKYEARKKRKKHFKYGQTEVAEVASALRVLQRMIEANKLTHDTIVDVKTYCNAYFNLHRFISRDTLFQVGYHTGTMTVSHVHCQSFRSCTCCE